MLNSAWISSVSRSFIKQLYGLTLPNDGRYLCENRRNKKSGKEWFKTVWKENGWQEKNDVWRIEFQLRRGALKELKILQVEDVSEKEDHLWQYLTTNWLKMNHPKWTVIQNSINPVDSPTYLRINQHNHVK